jgi:hypothetical protein
MVQEDGLLESSDGKAEEKSSKEEKRAETTQDKPGLDNGMDNLARSSNLVIEKKIIKVMNLQERQTKELEKGIKAAEAAFIHLEADKTKNSVISQKVSWKRQQAQQPTTERWFRDTNARPAR